MNTGCAVRRRFRRAAYTGHHGRAVAFHSMALD